MIQTFEKRKTVVRAMQFTGGRDNAMEICRWVGNDSAYIPATKEDPREYVQIPTMFGPRDMKLTEWVVKLEDDTYLTYKDQVMQAEYVTIQDEEQHLIQHARRELAAFSEEDPAFIESIMDAIKGFSSYRGHSGSSAAIAIQMVTALLNGENLLPLTDDPEEWTHHDMSMVGGDKDIWQNQRNSKALSYDGGKTYFLVGEAKTGEEKTFYTSVDHLAKPEIDPEDLKSDSEKDNAATVITD